MTKVFIEQPLASPGSPKYIKIPCTQTFDVTNFVGLVSLEGHDIQKSFVGSQKHFL